MSSRTRRSSGPVLPFAKAFQRSISPSPRAATSSSYPSYQSTYRSISPTRVNLPSVRFSASRSSPTRSMAATCPPPVLKKHPHAPRTCMCSPTTHPGSFRCSLHKNTQSRPSNNNNNTSSSYLPNRLNARRSAMANSLVRIGTVEGDLVRRALAQLIRPSSHQQKRRGAFQPRPSRLSIIVWVQSVKFVAVNVTRDLSVRSGCISCKVNVTFWSCSWTLVLISDLETLLTDLKTLKILICDTLALK